MGQSKNPGNRREWVRINEKNGGEAGSSFGRWLVHGTVAKGGGWITGGNSGGERPRGAEGNEKENLASQASSCIGLSGCVKGGRRGAR